MGDEFAERVAEIVEACKSTVYVPPEATVLAGGFRFDRERLNNHFGSIVDLLESPTGRRVLALAEALTPKEPRPPTGERVLAEAIAYVRAMRGQEWPTLANLAAAVEAHEAAGS